jgi:hypothetical protein
MVRRTVGFYSRKHESRLSRYVPISQLPLLIPHARVLETRTSDAWACLVLLTLEKLLLYVVTHRCCAWLSMFARQITWCPDGPRLLHGASTAKL